MNNAQFPFLVDWYRSLQAAGGTITSSESRISFDGIFDVSIYQKIEQVASLTIGGEFENHEVPSKSKIGQQVNFTYLLPQNDQGRFYRNLESLIKQRRSINKGVYEGNYYVMDLDFSAISDDFDENSKMQKLKNICKLISFLRDLNDFRDESESISFILKSSTYGNTLIIPIAINIDLFNNIHPNFSLNNNEIRDVMKSTEEGAHHQEKKLLLKLAIAQFLYQSDEIPKLLQIANGWAEILQIYENNLSAYLDNFSFEKTSLKITEEKIKLVKAINDILKDSVAKILAMPLSYGIILLAVKEPNIPFINIITLIALVVFGTVLSLSLSNQENLKKIIVNQSNKILLSSGNTPIFN